jgi:hypothetical protein
MNIIRHNFIKLINKFNQIVLHIRIIILFTNEILKYFISNCGNE